VYLATSPECGQAGAGAGLFPLPLARVVTRVFDGGQPYADVMLRFFADLSGLYGLPGQAGQMEGRARVTFTDMVSGILGELTGDGEPTGLVVLAHAAPDAEPSWPACFLTHSLPGEPLAFAVADQGMTAAFTALRIAASYIRSDRLRRASVVTLDQATLLADPAAIAGAPVPTQNRVTALIFDHRGTIGEASVQVAAGVTPAGLGPSLAGAGAEDGGRAAVVAGPGLAAHCAQRGPGRGAAIARAGIRWAPAGLPCTGIWSILADSLDEWRTEGVRQVSLTDYDAPTGCLGHCVLRLSTREQES
jgi:hypothetical protein